MTGTVTGVSARQPYAGDRWRVTSPNRSTISNQYQSQLGVERSGSRLFARFQQFRFRNVGI